MPPASMLPRYTSSELTDGQAGRQVGGRETASQVVKPRRPKLRSGSTACPISSGSTMHARMTAPLPDDMSTRLVLTIWRLAAEVSICRCLEGGLKQSGNGPECVGGTARSEVSSGSGTRCVGVVTESRALEALWAHGSRQNAQPSTSSAPPRAIEQHAAALQGGDGGLVLRANKARCTRHCPKLPGIFCSTPKKATPTLSYGTKTSLELVMTRNVRGSASDDSGSHTSAAKHSNHQMHDRDDLCVRNAQQVAKAQATKRWCPALCFPSWCLPLPHGDFCAIL